MAAGGRLHVAALRHHGGHCLQGWQSENLDNERGAALLLLLLLLSGRPLLLPKLATTLSLRALWYGP
jgi:hypothetical protein